MSLGYARRYRDGLRAIIEQAWGWQSEQPAAHVLEVMLSLVEDVIEHMDDLPEAASWAGMADTLSHALQMSDPDELRPGCERTDDVYEALRAHIWQQAAGREDDLKLWNVGDRFYVVAGSRRAARDLVLRETGLVGLGVRGVPHGAKLWDDEGLMGVSHELAAAHARPAILGRAA